MNYNDLLIKVKEFPSNQQVKFYCLKSKKYYYISNFSIDKSPYTKKLIITLTDDENFSHPEFNYYYLHWAIDLLLPPYRTCEVVFHTNNPLEKFTILDS